MNVDFPHQAVAYWQNGQIDEAIRFLDGLRHEGGPSASMLHLRGLLELERGENRDAATHLLAAIWLDPRNSDLLTDFAAAQLRLGRFRTASRAAFHACKMAPELAQAWLNLGQARIGLGNVPDAVEALRKSVDIEPANADAWSTLAFALLKQGQGTEAADAYSKLFQLPEEIPASSLKAGALALSDAGRWREAAECFRRLSEFSDCAAFALSQAIYCDAQECNWRSWTRDVEKLKATLMDSNGFTGDPTPYLSIPGIRGIALRRIASRFWMNTLGRRQPVTGKQVPLVNPQAKSGTTRVPRVGFLSGDFREHPVGRIIAPLLMELERIGHAVACYSFGPDDAGLIRRSIEAVARPFRDVSSLSDAEAAALITKDGIDIVIDLMGWSGNTRLGILAERPVPLQGTWLGYPGTLGVEGLADFVIGDSYTTPPSHSSHFAESIVCLSDLLICRPCTPLPPPPARHELGLPDDGVVLCSFATSYKLNPPIFDAWCEILKGVPDSVLWIGGVNDPAWYNLLAEARHRGLDSGRLVRADHIADRRQHLGRLQVADLALDTSPYGLHSTALDLIEAGVPLVTIAGETMPSRLGAGAMRVAGLPGMNAADIDGYVQIAVRTGSSPALLRSAKHHLLRHNSTSPLFDVARFARNLVQLWTESFKTLTPMCLLDAHGEPVAHSVPR